MFGCIDVAVIIDLCGDVARALEMEEPRFVCEKEQVFYMKPIAALFQIVVKSRMNG